MPSTTPKKKEANGITTTGLGFQKSVAIGLNFLRRVSFALFIPQCQGEIPLEVMVAGFPPRSIVCERIVEDCWKRCFGENLRRGKKNKNGSLEDKPGRKIANL